MSEQRDRAIMERLTAMHKEGIAADLERAVYRLIDLVRYTPGDVDKLKRLAIELLELRDKALKEAAEGVKRAEAGI